MKLTKAQHLVGLLILLPSMPLAIPLSLLVTLTQWANVAAEAIYDWVGYPFLTAHHWWMIRCERTNSARAALKGGE